MCNVKQILGTEFDSEQKTTNEIIKIKLFKKTNSNLKGTFNKVEDTRIRNKETNRCSSHHETEGNLHNKKMGESKTKWISKIEFKRFFGEIKSKSLIPNVISQSPYISPSSHKFRENIKEKWTNKKNFIIN